MEKNMTAVVIKRKQPWYKKREREREEVYCVCMGQPSPLEMMFIVCYYANSNRLCVFKKPFNKTVRSIARQRLETC